MSQLPLSNSTLLIGLTVLAICAGLAAVWLIVRARRPAVAVVSGPALKRPKLPPFAADGLRGRLDRLKGRMMDWLRHLTTRQEWRYQVPWVLVCGESRSGKSSLADSIDTGRNEYPAPRLEQLRVPGTRWSFFDRGVLIDPAGDTLPEPGQDDSRWKDILRRLIERRPERVLDAVVLTISAKTLTAGTRADVLRVAEDCYSQLERLLERCEFLLPVYVVVTQCDCIEGFAAFWRAQPQKCRAEILGWSNPCALENDYVPQWMDDAFDYLGGVLKQLQLQSAAADADIEDPDRFFLLPQRFLALKDHLSAVLAQVFRVSAYRSAPFFRGVYFVGSLDQPTADPLQPLVRVAFVDQLFTEKIFAEQNLARPIRQALWSRHRLTRRLQYAAVVMGVVLYLSLVQAAITLRHQVDIGMASVDLIRHPQHTARRLQACISEDTVNELLSNTSMMDVNVTSFVIPASWVDHRIEQSGLHLVANEAFEKVIFPAFACQLEQRGRVIADRNAIVHTAADSLTDDRERLQKYLEQVSAYEQNLARFRHIAAYSSADQSDALLSDLDALFQYLYGDPLPAGVRNRSGYHRKALAEVVYRSDSKPVDRRADIADRISRFGVRALAEIGEEIDSGAVLIDALSSEASEPLENAQRLDRWLHQMESEWSSATRESNPCSALADLLTPKLANLIRQYGYPDSLQATTELFQAGSCYEPAMRRLSELHVAPHGVLFHRQADRWQLTPAIQAEAEGLSGMIGLDLMQLTGGQPFACQQPVVGWQLANLEESAGYLREYHRYLGTRHLEEGQAVLPLYARVLRRQLQSVLDDGMTRSQVVATALQQPGGLDALAASEQALAQESAELVRTYPSLVWILDQYRQLGFDSAARVSQCVRRYASDALQRLALVSEASGLYDVQPEGSDDGDSLFALGPAPQVMDYLQGQFQRAQVLASYSGPFVTLLQNSDGNGDPNVARAAGPAYWDNTRQEVNRVLQFKDTHAQPALLNDFVVKELAGLNADNCKDVLNGYSAASYGNDLFSERRHGLENQARWRCRDQGQALALSQYQTWAHRFGAELAGQFPFAAVDASSEASLLVTRNFFADYSAQRDALRKKLNWLSAEGLGDVAQFLDRLDVAAKLFASAGGGPESLPPLKLKVEFRSLPAQSSGAQNIVSWRMATEDAETGFPNASTDMEWRYGQSVAVVVNWAALSPVAPVADPRQPDMRVDGNAVTFHADGPWALMRLILRHAATSAVRTDTLEQGTALLEFRVPTQGRQPKDAASPSRFYVAIRLLGVDPKTQTPVPLRWPDPFPTFAPTVW